MSIFITGDTHGDFLDNRFNGKNSILSELTKNDYLIVCGDFGFTWNEKTRGQWNANMMKRKYTTLFCGGNHENYDILNFLETTEMFGDEVGVFGPNTFYLLNGHMYEIEGKKFFIFGKASSIDRAWRIAEENAIHRPRTLWWEDEVPSKEEFDTAVKTLADNNYSFDYFISHTCRAELKSNVLGSYKADFYDPTETMIEELENLIKENNGSYKSHFFGHFHCNEDFDIEHCLYEKVVNISEGYYFFDEKNKYKFYENQNDNPNQDYTNPEYWSDEIEEKQS